MYTASKRLQAIRRQLLYMDEQYRSGIDEEEDKTDTNANTMPEKTQQAASIVNVLSSSTVSSHEQIGATANSVDFGNELGTLDGCCPNIDVNDIPLSEELRTAISNMEDLDDVDDLVGNVISAVQVEASYDTYLENLEHSITLPDDANTSVTSLSKASTFSTENLRERFESTNTMFMSVEEEESWRKSRRRKDNHNIIERRRRYNINDRIKELGSLLPPSIPSDLKQNKGSILKATVEYIKELKRDKQKLHNLEDIQTRMNSKHQKLLFRIFQLELKLKLYGLIEDSTDFRIKKKKSRKRFTDIEALVEGLCKQKINQGLLIKEKSSRSCRKNRCSVVEKCHEHERNGLENVKDGLRQHLNGKMAAGKPESDDLVDVSKFYQDLESQNKVPVRQSPMINQLSAESPRKQSLQSCSISNTSVMNTKGSNSQEKEEVIELSQEQCNLLLNLFENHGNVNEILLNENDLAHPDKGQCISPVTSASNMLEKLLRGNEGNSDASGLEDSTESNVGLR